MYYDDGMIECLWCDGLEVVFVIEELPTVVKKENTHAFSLVEILQGVFYSKPPRIIFRGELLLSW